MHGQGHWEMPGEGMQDYMICLICKTFTPYCGDVNRCRKCGASAAIYVPADKVAELLDDAMATTAGGGKCVANLQQQQ
jgi:hypothetical protein